MRKDAALLMFIPKASLKGTRLETQACTWLPAESILNSFLYHTYLGWISQVYSSVSSWIRSTDVNGVVVVGTLQRAGKHGRIANFIRKWTVLKPVPVCVHVCVFCLLVLDHA